MSTIIINLKLAAVYNIVVNVLKFFVRTAFINNLSLEYLGINSLFSNILSLLSLAELGIGPAIVYSLYAPLALNDISKTRAIMRLFKKAYIIIGLIILFLGLLMYPYLDLLIKEKPNIDDINLFYLIFLVNTAISYFWSYQRNLLIADQKQYIVNIYQTVIQVAVAIAQIIAIYITHNYWWFVMLMLSGTILENYLIANEAYRVYPYLTEEAEELNFIDKKQILQNIKAMIFHKIGGILSTSSSGIIISKLLGIVTLGIFNNYLLVIGVINTIAGKFYETITASIGNSIVLDSKEKSFERFNDIELLTAFQASTFSICIYVLLNPFIVLWIGPSFTADKYVNICITVYFYLNYMRKAVLLFKDAAGLFWHDRYKPLFEALFFLLFSIPCTIKLGLLGVFIGHILSLISTCFWIEPYVLFRFAFSQSIKKYLKNYFKYTCLTIFMLVISNNLIQFLYSEMSLVRIVLAGITIVVLNSMAWIIAFRKVNILKQLLH